MPAQIKTEHQRENTQYKTFQEYLIDTKHRLQTFKKQTFKKKI